MYSGACVVCVDLCWLFACWCWFVISLLIVVCYIIVRLLVCFAFVGYCC